jgi:hypothetical protein
MANASQKELTDLKVWSDSIGHEVANWVDLVNTRSDVGAKLSAALFNKETDNRSLRPPNWHLPAPSC